MNFSYEKFNKLMIMNTSSQLLVELRAMQLPRLAGIGCLAVHHPQIDRGQLVKAQGLEVAFTEPAMAI